MVGLMYPPPSYDAHELWHAMKVNGPVTYLHQIKADPIIQL
jgi:hypothetical protein